jgi:hypothetical protein
MNRNLPKAPWLHLLEPQWLAWREWQFIEGNNPDPELEARLVKQGLWPARFEAQKH